MADTREYLAVLSKAMKEDRAEVSSTRNHYNSLYAIIHNELNAQLKNSQYPNAPTLTQEVNHMLDTMEPFFFCDELVGTSCLLISNYSTNELFKYFKGLFLNSEYVNHLSHMHTQIPFVVFNGDSDSIEVLNYANKRIAFSLAEYELMIAESGKNRIALNKVVQAFIVKTPLEKKNVCLIFDNIYKAAELVFGRAVCKRIACIGQAGLQNASKRNLSQYDAITSDPKTEETISNNQYLSKYKFVRRNQLEEYYVHHVSPILYGFLDEFKSLEIQIESYYLSATHQAKESAQEIVSDIVRLGAGDDQTLLSIRHYEEARAKSLESERSKIHDVLLKTEACVTQIEKILDDTVSVDKLIPRSVLNYVFNGLFSGIKNDATIGRDVLSRLTTMEYADCGLVAEYVQCVLGNKAQIAPVPVQTGEWEKAKMFIEISDVDHLPSHMIRQYVNAIDSDHFVTGKEYYAKSLIVDNACKTNILMKSFARGYEPAGAALLERYKKGDRAVNLLSLANALVPEACMMLAEQRRANDQRQNIFVDLSNENFTYHKIAATRQYLPSIQIIVDSIYQSRFLKAYQLHGDDFQNPKFKAMIENGHALKQLSQYLISKLYNANHNSEILGVVLYSLNENLSEAMSCLSGINTGIANYCKGNMFEFGNGVSSDLDQAIVYYRKAVALGFDSYQLKKRINVCEQKQARRAYQDNSASNYHSTSSYRSSSSNYSSSSHSDSLCFITTATCQALNATDDCKELMLLRNFRDTHLQSTPEGEAVVREYYRIGPLIVDCINKTDNPSLMYQNLWDKYIKTSCWALESEQWEHAKRIYIHMVLNLCYKFKIAVRPQIRDLLKL